MRTSISKWTFCQSAMQYLNCSTIKFYYDIQPQLKGLSVKPERSWFTQNDNSKTQWQINKKDSKKSRENILSWEMIFIPIKNVVKHIVQSKHSGIIPEENQVCIEEINILLLHSSRVGVLK